MKNHINHYSIKLNVMEEKKKNKNWLPLAIGIGAGMILYKVIEVLWPLIFN